MNPATDLIDQRVRAALSMASDTRVLRLGDGVIAETAEVFRQCFGERPGMVIADANTFEAAGRRTFDVLRAAGVECADPFIFTDPDLHAHYEHVERLARALQEQHVIPVAVGSGTINDLAKMAAHHCHRPYMVVATAASMDGYTAFGASINRSGSKQTFFCPAPRGVVADMDIIGQAPAVLNAAGYADLAAKSSAGADWMVADALAIEPIDARAWSLVQDQLRRWISNPHGIRRGEHEAVRDLMEGLLMTGFAMQHSQSSRPASGAEHQFSHLWDMQDHHHQGRIPLHGHKVAIGTLAATRLYEALFEWPVESLDIERIRANWPAFDDLGDRVRCTHRTPDLRAVALTELQAKYVDHAALQARLTLLQRSWPTLREGLRRQLIPSDELREMLQAAGAPQDSAEIGIEPRRLRRSHVEAQQIRRRYTVLDLALETGLLSPCLDRLFPGEES